MPAMPLPPINATMGGGGPSGATSGSGSVTIGGTTFPPLPGKGAIDLTNPIHLAMTAAAVLIGGALILRAVR